MTPVLAVTVVILLGLGAGALRRSRIRTLEKIRARWGQPAGHERRLETIAASHRSRVSNLDLRNSLDDQTWSDLDLDAVFAAVDRTESTLGQHALYHRLRTAPVAGDLEAFEALVGCMEADAGLRERAQTALARLRDPHGYDLWWLAREDAMATRRWHVVFPILTATTLLLLLLTPFWSKTVPLLVFALASTVVVRYATDRQIGSIAAAFRQIAPVIATGEALRFVGSARAQPLVASLESDTGRLLRLKILARWISGDPFMLPMRVGSLALLVNDFVSAVYEYFNLAFLLDANGVFFGGNALRLHRAALLRVVAAIGDVDVAISVASIRAGRSDWTRPRFGAPGSPAILAGIRHPLILNAVPNSIQLLPGQGVLVTGSNMSGKSTFVRTVGVTTVLAQTLNTCFAAEYQAPVLRVRSCIGRSDDLQAGRSYYIAEVESLLGLVEASAAAEPHLFLLDELFRGTNAVERIAAGQAVLQELIAGSGRQKPHLVIAATHDAELVDLLAPAYRSHHFGDSIAADGLTFDHQLRPGPATTRNAIALLRLHGAPEDLIRRALASAAMLDRQRGTTMQGR